MLFQVRLNQPGLDFDFAWAAFLIWLGHHRRIKPPGLFALYVLGYSAYRIFEESLRIDSSVYILGLRLNMYIASALTIFGALWFYRTQRRPERVLVAAPPRAPETAEPGVTVPVAAEAVTAEGAAAEGASATGVTAEGAAARAVTAEGAAARAIGGASAKAENARVAGAGPTGLSPVPDDPAPAGNRKSRESQDSEQTTS